MTNSIHTVLVTGGSGFVAIHCNQQLLTQGYKVRTTLRSIHKKEKVIAMLIKGGVTNVEDLSFVRLESAKQRGSHTGSGRKLSGIYRITS